MTEQPGTTEQPDGTEQNGSTPEVSPLERRYRRLLYAYPRGYRSSRGDELVGTYLDLADRDRRWPSPHDAADLLRGGLRQRLREQGALGLVAALPVAATIALSTLVALAAFLLVQVELQPPDGVLFVGPVQTLGAFVWVGWLLAGLGTAVLPAGWARRVVAGAVLLTLAVVPVSPLTGLPRPPLYVLVPVLALGLTALPPPARTGWAGRVPPVLGALAGTVVAGLFEAAEGGGNWFTSYHSTSEILAMAGGVLIGLAVVVGLGRAVTGDGSGLWSALLLVTPASLLGIRQITEAYQWNYWTGARTWGELAGTTIAVTLLCGGLVLAVIIGRGVRYRAIRRRSAAGPCPTCGHVPDAGPEPGAVAGEAMP